MKQVLQSLRTGETTLTSIPCPALQPGHLLIRSQCSLISAGTERMLVEFGKAGWINKARQQPDRVRMVLDKARTDGIGPTIESVLNKLDQPLALGYSNAGVVIGMGPGVTGYSVGDRVASNGKHAEVVNVPANLCAKIPVNVGDDEAAFTVVGAIALQGVRLIQPTLGESVVVMGLGLIGLITVQLLRAHGCRVLGIDFDATRTALAQQLGAETVNLANGEDPLSAAQGFSRGRGIDGVAITASTKSSEPIHQAAQMSRKRGRIVLVGVTGLELSRADFYEKELTFQVSCSYGPGRYDADYEVKGFDYPIGFVRWTEQRNFEAVLDMMSNGTLDVRSLISHSFKLEQADQAYALVSSGEPSLGILLLYPSPAQQPETVLRDETVRLVLRTPDSSTHADRPVVLGFLGAGNHASGVLIPAFKSANTRLKVIASNAGVTGERAGRRFGFETTTTSTDAVFADHDVNVVVIATRHDSHAALVSAALDADKHVFVEKPLALSSEDLQIIETSYRRANAAAINSKGTKILLIGFNRRFAPQVVRMKALLHGVNEPKVLAMTVNAGAIPAEHWTQDRQIGGGRIIGEACHFIDLVRFLTGSPITSFQVQSLGAGTRRSVGDKANITLGFKDGSLATILYVANGHKSFPKERLEVFGGGRVLQLDNFRKLRGFGWPGFSKMNLWRQDKGHSACVKAFSEAVRLGLESPIPFDELMEVSRISIDVADALR